ncbi:DUF456 family protein [Bacillus sp. BGMRC 2118]|nr:DUF456 family protein [Bacillus sp. BGMRC 2118]
MEILYWLIIIVLFALAFIGLIYPIIPGLLFLVLGYIAYGLFFTFDSLSIFFWVIQGLFIVLLLVADYLGNILGVKKFGGSKVAEWGSTIGLLIGPFVIPFAGIILGPFLGAILAELIFKRKPIKEAFKVGVGSVLGFLSSTVVKFIIQIVMIIHFFFAI